MERKLLYIVTTVGLVLTVGVLTTTIYSQQAFARLPYYTPPNPGTPNGFCQPGTAGCGGSGGTGLNGGTCTTSGCNMNGAGANGGSGANLGTTVPPGTSINGGNGGAGLPGCNAGQTAADGCNPPSP
jgi:hypothetical protein